MIPEFPRPGWVIASAGQETGVINILFSKRSLFDHEKHCSLDCLVIEERRDATNYVYEEF